MFKRRKDNHSKSSLTLREQEWVREKMQMNDELHKIKSQANDDKHQLELLQSKQKVKHLNRRLNDSYFLSATNQIFFEGDNVRALTENTNIGGRSRR